MPEITEAELKKQIEKNNFAKLYFLYGEEKYMVEHYAQRLIAKASAEGLRDFNFQKFDGCEADMDSIAAAVEAMPVMAERKCVAVSDLDVGALRSTDAKKLEEILSDLPDTCVLVIYLLSFNFDEKRDKTWKKFLTTANKIGVTVPFRRLSQAQIEKFICACAEKRGCTITRQNAARMLSLCGTDLQTALNELEKLCAYTGSGEITAQTVDSMTVRNLEARVFDLSKAILAGASDRAYTILGQLFQQNEEPVSILAVLSGAYLDIYRVKASLQSGFSAQEPAKYFDYARKEFRLNNAAYEAKRFSTPMIRQSLDALLEADVALKSSRGDRRLVLEELLAKLIWIAEKEKIA
ncbi:DNA polymerase III subunit delta [Thermocaproicibacter melissae]|uniref:DNA polymerase III subunit delta n=1 Tax=Thermocaproicibacter melissae TaxID=2966552 RepID=UPI0024B27273|nr:DNA polymerase III subunit delta [Thermocaproicibacter melissae]WBY63473.1 DNA polymerase III subunit delta [Thermocaproicibacter melissae]